MSIYRCENFSIYGGVLANMLNGLWGKAHGSLSADPSPGVPGTVFNTDGTGNVSYVAVQNSSAASQGMAFRLWAQSLPCLVEFGWFSDAGINPRFFIQATASGRLQLCHQDEAGDNLAVISTTPGPVITANAWWHIEMKAAFNTSGSPTGAFELRVEGITVMTLTNINTEIPIAYNAGWGNDHQTPTAYIKDVVFWDTDGTENVDFLGSVIVGTLLPVADIALNWTPTPGGTPGYQILAGAPPQDLTAYIDAPNPPPGAYVCSMSQLDGDVTSVKCVQTVVRAAKTDGGDGSLQVGIISSPSSGPVTGEGQNRPITTAQTYWADVQEVDPKTGVPWLPSAVNVSQLRINRTT